MTTIEVIELRTILDSRGNPTVEADIYTAGGFGRSAAPSGASTGSLEAKVRPPDEAVDNAIQNLIPALIGMDACDQEGFDEQLRDIDGTADFSGIGANVAVALSLANAKAAASSMKPPALPLPWRGLCKGDPAPAREHYRRRCARGRTPPRSRSSLSCRAAQRIPRKRSLPMQPSTGM